MSLIDEARALIARSEENTLDEGHDATDYELYEDENLAIGEEAIVLLQRIVKEDDEVNEIVQNVLAKMASEELTRQELMLQELGVPYFEFEGGYKITEGFIEKKGDQP
ncbi:hypothetical protein SEA_ONEIAGILLIAN_88 [Microbacterium phage OneinaGillian]|uniref:Uncharacterized protein n=1 Tax=Microbacterium phage OneinaGillian TaxID=2301604 RepID=A0A385UF94_9CAUD|nr:hypothetical protein HOU23_gp088 [Microbacterium phage OneinaGillian]AYB70198.1 hypothetical protein SEA_ONEIAGILLIAN_88 [Microbacterium phage OneinaGillian]